MIKARRQVMFLGLVVASVQTILPILPGAQADTIKGGIEEHGYGTMDAGAQYGAPKMIPMQPQAAPVRPPMRANIQQSAPPPSRPIQATIQKRVELPPGFLGAWAVQGQRTKVEAMPEFQAGAEQAFATATNNMWNIGGNAQSGYTMSNGSMSTQLWVDKVEGGTAFIRYQHPVGKTMAQEAIVMSLVPGGAQFNGLERISIVKQGLAQPRAKVTYQLMGQRRR